MQKAIIRNQYDGYSSLFAFLIYNHKNNLPIDDIMNQIKFNTDKTQSKVLDAEYVKEYL